MGERRPLRDTLLQLGMLLCSAWGLALAFPRTDWGWAAWIVLVPLFTAAVGARARVAFGWGWLFGTVFFTILLRWLDYTFVVYSAIPWPLTWAPIVALSAYCGLWIALPCAAMAWIAGRRSPTWALAAAPFLWVAGEWCRGHFFGGFPWGTLGYSQYLHLAVIQIAELAGVSAVSFVIVAVNAGLTACLLLTWRRAVTFAAVVAVLVVATVLFGRERLAEPLRPGQVTVTLVQPSIEQPLKWDAEHTRETLAIYFALLKRVAEEKTDLIVWPESASPTILTRDPALVGALSAASARLGAPMLMGSIDASVGPPLRFRNTAFLVTGHGLEGRYDKIHLVPFGEYIPLSGVIGFVRRWAEFISELEPGSRAVVFPGPPAPFGVVICYEGIFPDLVRQFVRNGARFMVNMTNDAWFGRTDGPWQHLAMYPFRAVEHRITVVRAANTGVSAFIAPTGLISRRLGLFERDVVTDDISLRVGRTLYGRLGDWLAYLSFLVSAAVLAWAGRSRGAA